MLELEIVRAELSEADKFGKHTIIIKQVKLLKDGKYKRFVKLNDNTIKALKSGKIEIDTPAKKVKLNSSLKLKSKTKIIKGGNNV